MTALFFKNKTVAATKPMAWLGFQLLLAFESGVELISRVGTICCLRVLSCTGGLTWKPGGWLCGGFSNCLRVVKGSSFICRCSHCEEHFMPRDFLALNPEICHKMLLLIC